MLDLHDKWNETVCELFLKQMEQRVCLADDIKEVNLRLCFGLCWWDTCCIQRQCTTGDNVHLVISINTTQVHLHTQTPVPPHTDPSTSTHRLQHLHTQTLMYVPTDIDVCTHRLQFYSQFRWSSLHTRHDYSGCISSMDNQSAYSDKHSLWTLGWSLSMKNLKPMEEIVPSQA